MSWALGVLLPENCAIGDTFRIIPPTAISRSNLPVFRRSVCDQAETRSVTHERAEMPGGVVYKISLDPNIRIATALVLLVAIIVVVQPSRFTNRSADADCRRSQVNSAPSAMRPKCTLPGSHRAWAASRPFAPGTMRNWSGQSSRLMHSSAGRTFPLPNRLRSWRFRATFD